MRTPAVAVLVASLAAVSACSDSPKSSAQRGTAEHPFVIGMSQCNLGEPWRVQMNADVEAAAKAHPELKMLFKDAQNDSLTQQAQVREFLDQGIDALIISPKEAAPLTKPVAEVFAAKIPVIVLDRAVEGDAYTCFIGGDNRLIGAAAGRFVAESFPSGAKIVELKGLMTSVPGVDRHEGFASGLGGRKDLEIVFDADMQWLEDRARKEMESALAAQPKIDVVYAHNDPGAHGAWLAAKAAGREHEMKFVGIDALPHEGVEYVKQGILAATFQYPTGGKEAIDVALDLLHGKSAPKKIVLSTRIFTKDNVAAGGTAIGSEAPAK